jgi:hypothetical protein
MLGVLAILHKVQHNKFETCLKREKFFQAFIETMQSKKIWIFDSEFV